MTGPGDITVDVDAGVATITLADPARRNSLGRDEIGRLREILSAIAPDASTRIVVVRAEGPAFSAGHDLREMQGRDLAYYEDLFDACSELMLDLRGLPQPVIAAVDGVATAAGCQLVASCDLVVASDRSTFATPGVRIGLFCSTPMVALSRAIGAKRAMEMLLTGLPIDASTACDWGLVNRVVAPDDLDDAVDALVASIIGHSGRTIATGKAAFYHQIDLDERAAYDYTKGVMSHNAADDVAAEGIAAFLEKRPPDWPDGSETSGTT